MRPHFSDAAGLIEISDDARELLPASTALTVRAWATGSGETASCGRQWRVWVWGHEPWRPVLATGTDPAGWQYARTNRLPGTSLPFETRKGGRASANAADFTRARLLQVVGMPSCGPSQTHLPRAQLMCSGGGRTLCRVPPSTLTVVAARPVPCVQRRRLLLKWTEPDGAEQACPSPASQVTADLQALLVTEFSASGVLQTKGGLRSKIRRRSTEAEEPAVELASIAASVRLHFEASRSYVSFVLTFPRRFSRLCRRWLCQRPPRSAVGGRGASPGSAWSRGCLRSGPARRRRRGWAGPPRRRHGLTAAPPSPGCWPRLSRCLQLHSVDTTRRDETSAAWCFVRLRGCGLAASGPVGSMGAALTRDMAGRRSSAHQRPDRPPPGLGGRRGGCRWVEGVTQPGSAVVLLFYR